MYRLTLIRLQTDFSGSCCCFFLFLFCWVVMKRESPKIQTCELLLMIRSFFTSCSKLVKAFDFFSSWALAGQKKPKNKQTSSSRGSSTFSPVFSVCRQNAQFGFGLGQRSGFFHISSLRVYQGNVCSYWRGRLHFNRPLITTSSVRLEFNTAVMGSKIEESSAGLCRRSGDITVSHSICHFLLIDATVALFYFIPPRPPSIYSGRRSAIQRHQFNNGGLALDELRVIFLLPQGRGDVWSQRRCKSSPGTFRDG